MAKIALIGASGNAGSRILNELSARGHTVTAIARHPDNVKRLAGVTAVKADVQDEGSIAAQLNGHNAVISAVRFLDSDPNTLINAVRMSGVKRYLVVGGAASLETAPGVRLLDTPDFPAAYRAEATKGAQFLDLLRNTEDLDWSFISPSAMFVPGSRTGKFRLAKDQLLISNQGVSSISFEDYAVAMVDEIENPKHIRQRFTVGY